MEECEVNDRTYLKLERSLLYFGQTDRIATKRVNKLEFKVWGACAYRESIVTNVPFDRVGRHEANTNDFGIRGYVLVILKRIMLVNHYGSSCSCKNGRDERGSSRLLVKW